MASHFDLYQLPIICRIRVSSCRYLLPPSSDLGRATWGLKKVRKTGVRAVWSEIHLDLVLWRVRWNVIECYNPIVWGHEVVVFLVLVLY